MIPIAILGITSTVLGFFPLSAVMSIVLITVTVLLVLTMMGTDGFFMWNGWKHGGVPGQYDKLYLALVSLVMVTAMAVSVGRDTRLWFSINADVYVLRNRSCKPHLERICLP